MILNTGNHGNREMAQLREMVQSLWGEVGGEAVVCYLVSHCHGEVVEDGLDGAKGLVVGERGRRAEGRVAPEELVNVLQEHVNVEGGEDGGELPGNAPQTLATRKKESKHHGIEASSQ